MNTHVKGTTSRCNRLLELPPVLTEWQQKAYCPDCDYYCDGQCCKPIDSSGNAACPFDGKALPLREVTVETPKDPAKRPLDVGPWRSPGEPASVPGTGAGHQTQDRRPNRAAHSGTGGRIDGSRVGRPRHRFLLLPEAACVACGAGRSCFRAKWWPSDSRSAWSRRRARPGKAGIEFPHAAAVTMPHS